MPVGPGEASRAEASTMGMVLLVETERFQTAHRVRAECLRGMHSMALASVIGVWTSIPRRHSQNGFLEFAIFPWTYSRQHRFSKPWQVCQCLCQRSLSLLAEREGPQLWGTGFARTCGSVLPVVEEWSARLQEAIMVPMCQPFRASMRSTLDQKPFALHAHTHCCRKNWPNQTLAKHAG